MFRIKQFKQYLICIISCLFWHCQSQVKDLAPPEPVAPLHAKTSVDSLRYIGWYISPLEMEVLASEQQDFSAEIEYIKPMPYLDYEGVARKGLSRQWMLFGQYIVSMAYWRSWHMRGNEDSAVVNSILKHADALRILGDTLLANDSLQLLLDSDLLDEDLTSVEYKIYEYIYSLGRQGGMLIKLLLYGLH